MIYVVYLLLLKNNKYYVGMTPYWRLEIREKEHFAGRGSKWTRRYPPIELLEVWEFPNKDTAHKFEIKKTEEYLHLHGIDSCRGGVCNYGREGGYNYWVRPHLRYLIPT
jgi:predicted GIY-YIG superfamily endonuclease